jgi:hypothetical protein
MVAKSLLVGESRFEVLDLGDDANAILRIAGLDYSHFTEGELVSAVRSSGKTTIAQIGTLCPEYVVLALGNGLEKQIAPNVIGKLIGPYCLRNQLAVFQNGSNPATTLAQMGSSNLFPIHLGQDCTMLKQSGGFSPNCFYLEELVSFSSARICVAVKNITQHSVTVTDGFRTIQIFENEVVNILFKLHDRVYLVDPICPHSFPCIKVGRTKFQGLMLGHDTSGLARTNNYRSHDFFVGEAVSVKEDGLRIAHQVQSVNADGSISVVSSKTHIVSTNDVSKLEGSFYIIDGNPDMILIKVFANCIQMAQTTAYPLLLGADASSTPQIADCGAIYVNEAVSVLRDDGSLMIGQVTFKSHDLVTVAMFGEPDLCFPHGCYVSRVRRLLGCYLISDFPLVSPQMQGTSPPTWPSPQHVRQMLPRCSARFCSKNSWLFEAEPEPLTRSRRELCYRGLRTPRQVAPKRWRCRSRQTDRPRLCVRRAENRDSRVWGEHALRQASARQDLLPPLPSELSRE